MFKSKLQELCQGKGWLLPEYQTSKGGFDHEPRFLAKVDVDGQTFSSSGNARSSKQAQNEAARAALKHFLAPPLHQDPIAASVPQLPSIALTMQGANLRNNDVAHGAITPPKKLIKKLETETATNNQNPCKIGEEVPVKEAIPVAFNSTNQIAKLIALESSNTHFQDVISSSIPDTTPKPDQTITGTERSVKQRIQDIVEQPNNVSNKMRNIPAERSIINNDNTVSKVSTSWKSCLQEHCQKNKNALPVYTCERYGPDHCRRFKCKVTVNGQIYASENHFPTIKEAESDAARVALISMPSIEVKDDDTNYKNLLQELAQKSRLDFPVYTHTSTGEPHNLTFVSTVSIGDRSFSGEGFKTKKSADMSAAKAAYKILTEKGDVIKATKQPEESRSCFSDVVSYMQKNIQPKIGGSSSDPRNAEVDSQIKALLEKNPLCRKGVVVYPKELRVSFPNGHVESIADDKWIITNFKPL